MGNGEVERTDRDRFHQDSLALRPVPLEHTRRRSLNRGRRPERDEDSSRTRTRSRPAHCSHGPRGRDARRLGLDCADGPRHVRGDDRSVGLDDDAGLGWHRTSTLLFAIVDGHDDRHDACRQPRPPSSSTSRSSAAPTRPALPSAVVCESATCHGPRLSSSRDPAWFGPTTPHVHWSPESARRQP